MNRLGPNQDVEELNDRHEIMARMSPRAGITENDYLRQSRRYLSLTYPQGHNFMIFRNL